MKAVYNLPCMNLLYKSMESELKISFQEIYLKFSEDAKFEVRYCAATSLHEAFKLIEDEDDISCLRQVFISYILDSSREMILLMNKSLPLMIKHYGNKHTIENFKGRTAYVLP
jgi:DNA replication protein DnaC